MTGKRVVLYFAWSRPEEVDIPLGVIDNRFPALFESRRMLYPRYEDLASPTQFDQGIAGFLDHIQLPNFVGFSQYAERITKQSVSVLERIGGDTQINEIDDELLRDVDTLIVISLDSLRTHQQPSNAEVAAIRRFLSDPDHMLFVCPHHDIGDVVDIPETGRAARQEQEFYHHGDRTIPPQQRFGGFARSLLETLDVPVENRFGLHPRLEESGSPWPFKAERSLDRFGLLRNVQAFNAHPHLPHLVRVAPADSKLDVLVRVEVDPNAPTHPFCQSSPSYFDALLQTRPGVFEGTLLVCDATIWSSTAGGVEQLQTFWSNVLRRTHPL